MQPYLKNTFTLNIVKDWKIMLHMLSLALPRFRDTLRQYTDVHCSHQSLKFELEGLALVLWLIFVSP